MTNQIVPRSDFLREFSQSKSGMAGVIILLSLIIIMLYAILAIPLESFRQWNNPNYWINYPKAAAPQWTNTGLFGPKVFEHLIMTLDDASITKIVTADNIRTEVHSYAVDFSYDSYPNDFMIPYSVKYGQIPPVLQVDIIRPDGIEFRIYYSSLPSSLAKSNENQFSSRIFSTDPIIADYLRQLNDSFRYAQDSSKPQVMIFSDIQENKVLKGKYLIKETFYLFNDSDTVQESGLILGGRVYGLMGTDELRRDLAIGILWGAPVALFIGLSVSIGSVVIGLIYGVMAGYKGNRTDDGLMLINDIFYTLPALPLLVIMSVTLGRSIFLITGFLVIFGWAGAAKVTRSLAMKMKNLQYVEAAKLMGQSDIKIIFKHIIPQLLPLTFASIAISVPAAILGEAALSFLGLGDPSIPTWGQILHEANSASAASRGLWWWIVPPGVMIALTGLSFILIGNTLDSILNPKARKF
ncbi:MAG TPA: ABC transporter permease [Nitrososphaeraceae archaeon]|jgi:peptide/nickel transport system permease protein|nr:ABC transporter permease [Nitrososphaeraceae archaeon]